MGAAVKTAYGGRVVGVGVDIEGNRTIDPKMTRFFLTKAEQTARPDDWLRLWTVKEALFKACPANDGRLLSDFEIDDPHATAGTARLIGNTCLLFHYTSSIFGESFISLALCEEVKQ